MFARRRRAWDGNLVELYGLQNTFLIIAIAQCGTLFFFLFKFSDQVIKEIVWIRHEFEWIKKHFGHKPFKVLFIWEFLTVYSTLWLWVLVTISKDHGKQGLHQRMLIFSPTKKAKKIPGSIGRGHKRKEFLWGYPYNSRGLFFKRHLESH